MRSITGVVHERERERSDRATGGGGGYGGELERTILWRKIVTLVPETRVKAAYLTGFFLPLLLQPPAPLEQALEQCKLNAYSKRILAGCPIEAGIKMAGSMAATDIKTSHQWPAVVAS